MIAQEFDETIGKYRDDKIFNRLEVDAAMDRFNGKIVGFFDLDVDPQPIIAIEGWQTGGFFFFQDGSVFVIADTDSGTQSAALLPNSSTMPNLLVWLSSVSKDFASALGHWLENAKEQPRVLH